MNEAEQDRESMSYELRFSDDGGEPWRLTGTKMITGKAPWTVLRDLITLHTTVQSEEGSGEQVSAVLRISAQDVARQLAAVRGTGFPRARRLGTTARFVGFFTSSAAGRP
ncbi:hypothetical protein [Nesterenkonia ebinurensis]|uniref:hypothetical protein n=1 Tax=Nesterenkonia ebinurensis TaxID=2608252 RepID=UPI00123CC8DA|nr:hypothetical protein [Nesterenkonia ebinurensis]